MGTVALSVAGKQPRRTDNHSPQSSAEDKNEWCYTSTPSVCLHGLYRDSYTFTFSTEWTNSVENQLRKLLSSSTPFFGHCIQRKVRLEFFLTVYDLWLLEALQQARIIADSVLLYPGAEFSLRKAKLCMEAF
jgi:hypothetical protein